MPDEYKHYDVIEGYKTYYINDKKRFATWKKRKTPQFMLQET